MNLTEIYYIDYWTKENGYIRLEGNVSNCGHRSICYLPLPIEIIIKILNTFFSDSRQKKRFINHLINGDLTLPSEYLLLLKLENLLII